MQMVLAQTPLTAFQSPKSGKFVSNMLTIYLQLKYILRFNPLDRGNLYQICPQKNIWNQKSLEKGFNPLDRGNLYQIHMLQPNYRFLSTGDCFNPLDRGKLYLIRIKTQIGWINVSVSIP